MHNFPLRWAICAAVICTWLSAEAYANSPYSAAVITTTNPTLYWDLEETSGTTANDLAAVTGGVNNGTYVDLPAPSLILGALGPQPADGFPTMSPDVTTPAANNAVRLSHQGANGVEFLTLATAPASVSTSQFSMATWFIGDTSDFANQNISYVMSRGNSNSDVNDLRDAAGVGGAGFAPRKLFLTDINSGVGDLAGADVTPGVWHHLAVVRDDTLATQKVKLYLDGVQRLSLNTPWFGGSGDVFTVGTRQDYTTPVNNGTTCCGLEGRVDEVAVWNRSLTAAEVASLYQLGIVIPEPTSISLAAIGAIGLFAVCRRRAIRPS